MRAKSHEQASDATPSRLPIGATLPRSKFSFFSTNSRLRSTTIDKISTTSLSSTAQHAQHSSMAYFARVPAGTTRHLPMRQEQEPMLRLVARVLTRVRSIAAALTIPTRLIGLRTLVKLPQALLRRNVARFRNGEFGPWCLYGLEWRSHSRAEAQYVSLQCSRSSGMVCVVWLTGTTRKGCR